MTDHIETVQAEEVPQELSVIVSQSGLEQTKGQKLLAMFTPYFKTMGEIELKINSINKDNPTAIDMKIAREIRLSLKDNRVASEKAKDESKGMILIEGRLIDNLNNIVKNTSKGLELQCEQIEKFAEIQEQKRKEELKATRLEILMPITDQAHIYPLGEMTQESFDDLVNGLVLAAKAKKEAEEKLEAERIERERIDRLHTERKDSVLHLWNFTSEFEKTLNFGEQSDSDFNNFIQRLNNAKAEHDKIIEQQRIENERLRKEAEEKQKALEAERKAAEEKARIEKEKSDKTNGNINN